MKRAIIIFITILGGILAGCEPEVKEPAVPEIGEIRAESLSSTSVRLTAELTGGENAKSLGFKLNGDSEHAATIDGEMMVATLRELKPSTSYEVWAFASNGMNMVRSESFTFTTEDQFPDPAFREYVLSTFDSDGDGFISEDEADAVQSLNPPEETRRKLQNVKGLGIFRNIQDLRLCGYWDWTIALKAIDLSTMRRLTSLYLTWGMLESLDIPQCMTDISVLNFDYNFVTELDLKGIVSADYIQCTHNKLTSIDFRNLERVGELHVDGNRLKVMDLSRLKSIGWLICRDNPALEKVILSRKTTVDFIEKDSWTQIEYVD
jgi:hypothetical protein